MTSWKKLAATLAGIALVTGTAHAAPLTEWIFNPVGQGFESGQYVSEYLDTNGLDFVEVERTGSGTVAFREHAVFNIVQADSSGQLLFLNYPGGFITGLYEAFGSGELGGAYRYAGGRLRLYQNPVIGQYGSTVGIYGANLGKLIGDVKITGGGGTLDATGSAGRQSTLFARISRGDLASGYFFGADGTDLAQARNLEFILPLAMASTISQPGGTRITEIACEFAGFTGPGCAGGSYTNVQGDHYLLSTNGQLRLVDVPEPGSLALFGVAVFAAAAARRRRAY